MVIVKKKNYIGLKFEMDVVHYKIDYKGIAIKRRNYCNTVKDIYWDVIYPSLGLQKVAGKISKVNFITGDGPKTALQSLQRNLHNLVQHSRNQATSLDYFDDFLVSASLKSHYKSENLPHLQLAKRMKQRDELSAPKSGQRFNYIVVRDIERVDDLSAKSEDPVYAFENQLPLDYIFYLENQIKKPVMKFLDIIGVGAKAETIFRDTYNQLYDDYMKKVHVRANAAKRKFFSGEKLVPIKIAKKIKPKKKVEKLTKIDSFFKIK